MAHAKSAAAGFSYERERGHKRGLEGVLKALLIAGVRPVRAFKAALHFRLKLGGTRGKVCARKLLHLGLEHVDAVNVRRDFLDVALVLGADEARDDAIYYLFDVHVVRFE